MRTENFKPRLFKRDEIVDIIHDDSGPGIFKELLICLFRTFGLKYGDSNDTLRGRRKLLKDVEKLFNRINVK